MLNEQPRAYRETDDPMARTVAEHDLAGHLEYLDSDLGQSAAVERARRVLAGYESIRFETTDTVEGKPMRRLVLTGQWEIDPNGTSRK